MQVQNIIDLENALILVFKGAAFFHYTYPDEQQTHRK